MKYNEVSFELDMNHSYISAVLRGRQNMLPKEFFKFCRLMGITEEQFFHLESKYPQKEYELLCEARKLPDKVFMTYLEQIKAYNEVAGH